MVASPTPVTIFGAGVREAFVAAPYAEHPVAAPAPDLPWGGVTGTTALKTKDWLAVLVGRLRAR